MLSVVVIGKNAAAFLPACLDSVAASLSGFDHEVLYVDARSGDGSRALALSRGARVLVPEEARTTPALGRFLGARAARGEWLLFLDHDMRLVPGFIEAALAEAARGGWQGIVGQRTDFYLGAGRVTGRCENYFGVTRTGPARAFGGAVLLQREALLRAGNWAPPVETYEEVELYARLRKHGVRVAELPVPMIRHYDEQRGSRSPLRVLVNRRRLGLGQAVVHAIGCGSLGSLLLLERRAFATWLLQMLSIIALFSLGAVALLPVLLLQALTLLALVLRGEGRSFVTHTLLLLYLPLGMLSLRARRLDHHEEFAQKERR